MTEPQRIAEAPDMGIARSSALLPATLEDTEADLQAIHSALVGLESAPPPLLRRNGEWLRELADRLSSLALLVSSKEAA